MADNITIKVTGVKEAINRLNKAKKNVKEEMSMSVYRAALYLQGKVREDIQGKTGTRSVDTGHFAKMTYAKKTGTFEAVVGNDLPYAKYLEYGTSSHFVAPKNAKALHWDGFFSKGHMVGGIKARRHFGNTARREKANIQKIIQNNINKAGRQQ